MPKYGKLATREAFYTRVLDDVRALPGVIDAGFISYLPIGDARRHLAGVARRPRPVNRADNQNAFLRYVTPGYFATLGIPLKRGRATSPSPTPATGSSSRWSASRSSSATGRTRIPASRPPLHLRLRRARRRRRRRRRADARPRAPGEPQVYLSYKQVADDCDHRLHPAQLRGAVDDAAGGAGAVDSRDHRRASIRRCRSPKSATLDRRRRPRHRVARGAAARARRVRGDRVRARRHRHPRPAVVRRVAARAGDRRAHRARRAAERHPVDGGAAAAVVLAVAGLVPGVALAYAAGRSMEALLAGVKPADATTLAAAVTLVAGDDVPGKPVPDPARAAGRPAHGDKNRVIKN